VPDVTRLAVFGGVYSNSRALAAAIFDARRWGAEGLFALGDFGAFGPHPDRVFPILLEAGVESIQGNYEESLSTDAADCHCGYTDPRDNHFAQVSYDYTAAKTSPEWKRWMATLPKTRRLEIGGRRILLVHGSPRRINEFLWESTSPVPFLEKLLADHSADVLLCTHTGLHWQRRLPSGRLVVNCGVLGRPANDGGTNVWYARLEVGAEARAELVPVVYDFEAMAREMGQEKLPPEFIDTIRTGWWTTCLEILPARERSRGRY
jgi:diadenosine tetraphosphatase ApaH/serine/threonine PP2A family protein phosphatase